MAAELVEKLHERICRLFVVIHDEYALGHPFRGSVRAWFGSETEDIGDGEPDNEFASFALSVAAGFDGALMQLDNLLHKREPDAESAHGTGGASLVIDVKDVGKVVGVNTFTVVAYLDDRVPRLLRKIDPNGAARRCEFCRIVHQVGDGLFEPRIVCPYGEERRGIGKVERDVLCAQKRVACLERTLDELAQLEGVGDDFDFCLREARDVEQVAKEFGKVVELIFDVIQFLTYVGRGFAPLQELKCAFDWRERIAELVRERSQKEVLRLVAFGYFVAEATVVENDAEVVAEFSEEFKVVARVHAARLCVSERECAERIAERANRNNHE